MNGELIPLPLPEYDGATFEMTRVTDQTAPLMDQTAPLTPTWHEPRHRAPADEALAAPPADDGPCRCGMCPEPDPDCKDALLSYAPGVTTRMAAERVRNGQWVDIPATSRMAWLRINKPAVDNQSRIRGDVDHGHLNMAPLFDRTPDLHDHAALGAGLRLAVRVLAAQLQAWQPGEPPRTIAEMGAAVEVTAAIAAERMVSS